MSTSNLRYIDKVTKTELENNLREAQNGEQFEYETHVITNPETHLLFSVSGNYELRIRIGVDNPQNGTDTFSRTARGAGGHPEGIVEEIQTLLEESFNVDSELTFTLQDNSTTEYNDYATFVCTIPLGDVFNPIEYDF